MCNAHIFNASIGQSCIHTKTVHYTSTLFQKLFALYADCSKTLEKTPIQILVFVITCKKNETERRVILKQHFYQFIQHFITEVCF